MMKQNVYTGQSHNNMFNLVVGGGVDCLSDSTLGDNFGIDIFLLLVFIYM